MKKGKGTNIKFRITAEEKKEAQAQAEAAGLSLSSLARALLAGVHLRTKADVSALAELRKLGGLCKHALKEGGPHEASQAFKALEQAAARLAR